MKTTIIAEVGMAHDGSLALAHAYIDACAGAGADIVKFQWHHSNEGTANEPFRVTSGQDASRQAYWKRTAFTTEQWFDLRMHCEACGLDFMTSVFCLDAFHEARSINQQHWKIPSGQVTNTPLLEAIGACDEPVYISAGLGSGAELTRALKLLRSEARPVTILHTVTEYPTPPERWHLSRIDYLSSLDSRAKVGYSDHSGTLAAPIAAIAAHAATAIEVHVAFDGTQAHLLDGPASLDFLALSLLAGARDALDLHMFRVVREVTNYRTVTASDMRQRYLPSVVSACELNVGDLLTPDKLAVKKAGSGGGLRYEEVVGRYVLRSVPPDYVFTQEDVTT